MDLGKKILEYRKKTGLSQEELGYKLNVTRQSVSLWETNQAQPSVDNLLALSKILNVSLDELCGKEVVSNIEESINKPLFKAEVTYTEEIYKNTYKSFYNKHLTINYIAITLSILIFIGILLSDTENTFVILPFICSCVFIGYILRVGKTTNEAVKNALTSRPNLKSEYSFYDDYFMVNSTSGTSNGSYSKKYSDIKLLNQDERYIYLTFDGLFAVIDKNSCRDNEEKLLKLLNLTKVETGINKKVKSLLLIAFIASITSIWLALMLVVFSVETSPLPDFPFAMVEHMWKFFLIIPIPLASVILGLIYIRKGYKCKKNIIAGIIMTVLLSVFGTFTSYFSTLISHDMQYIYKLSETTNLNIPGSSYISIAYDYQTEGDSLAMVKIDDDIMYTSIIKDNLNWKEDTSFIPSSISNLFILSLTSNYEYYSIYNVTNSTYNTFDGNLIFMAYDIDTNILFIYCYN